MSHSSTFDSELGVEAHGRRARARASALVALIVLITAELVIRALPQLPVPLRWNDNETDLKATQLARLASTGRSPSIVYFGSSIIDAAVEPETVESIWPKARNGYNAGIEGMDGRSISAWATKVVEPVAHPRIAVIGLSPRELNDNGIHQHEFNSTFFDSSGWRKASGNATLADRLNRFAEQHSELVRSRSRLRDPYNSINFWRNGSAAAWASKNDPVTGRTFDFDLGTYRAPTGTLRSTILNSYQTTAQLAVLRSAISELQRRGTIVVILAPARITSDLVGDVGSALVSNADAAVLKLAESTCSPFIDLRDSIPGTSGFVDLAHVNKAGAHAESLLLGGQLAALDLTGNDTPGC